jgi:hypothetical protein
MNYSLEKINTVAACDALLALAQKEKHKLEHERLNMGESIVNFTERVDYIGNELASVHLLLETFTPMYHTLPEGNDKVCMNVEVTRLELRKAQLYKMAVTCNVPALLAKQVGYNKLDSKVSAIDNYIVAVEYKRAALVNVASQVQVEDILLKALPSEGLRIPAEDTSASQTASFYDQAVVHEKQQTEKNVYSFHALFSSADRCTIKITARKKVVQLPDAFVRPFLGSVTTHEIQTPRDYP